MSWLVAVGIGHVHEITEREHIELALAAALHAHGADQINNPMVKLLGPRLHKCHGFQQMSAPAARTVSPTLVITHPLTTAPAASTFRSTTQFNPEGLVEDPTLDVDEEES